MDYAKIFTASFSKFRKYKTLWIFGVAAALAGRSEYGFTLNYRDQITLPKGTPTLPWFSYLTNLFKNFFDNPLPYLGALFVISVIGWVIAELIGWTAKGAIISMVDEIDQTGDTNFLSGLNQSAEKVDSLFFISFILAIPQFVLFAPLAFIAYRSVLPILTNLYKVLGQNTKVDSETLNNIFGGKPSEFINILIVVLTVLCAGTVLSWVLNLINILAARSCIIEKQGVFSSIGRGWQMFTKYFGYIVVTAILLSLLQGIFAFVAAIPTMFLFTPFIKASLQNPTSPTALLAGISLLIYLLIVAVGIGGALTGFNNVLWTQLYKGFITTQPVQDHTIPS